MEGGEEVIKTGRANEVLVKADQLTGVTVREGEVEVDDVFRFDADLLRNETDYALVVLAKDLPLAR